MPELKAAKDRVLLRFPKAAEKIGAIHIPNSRQLRPEIGELVHVGDGLTPETRQLAQDIFEHAAAGGKFLVPMHTGTYYWREELGEEFEFLKDIRSYRVTEIATFLMP